MIAQELIAVLGFDVRNEAGLKRFNSGMQNAAKRAQQFARRIAIVGTAAAGAATAASAALYRFVDPVAKQLDTLGKTADRVGVAVKPLQELQYAASQAAGVTEQTLNMALQRFSRRVGEAANGSGELKGIIEELGINIRNTDGSLRTSEDLLGDFADAVQNAGSEQEKLRIAFKMFDSEGAALVNMMKDGSGSIEELRKEAEALGIVMSDEAIEASTRFVDAQDRVKRSMNGFRNLIATRVMPVFSDWMDEFTDFWKESVKNGSVDRWVRTISDGLLNVLGAVRSFGRTLYTVGKAVGNFVSNILGLNSAWKGLMVALGAVSMLIAPWITGFAILFLVVDDFINYMNGNESVIGDIFERWGEPVNNAIQPIKDFFAAFKAGFDAMGGNEAIAALGDAVKSAATSFASLGTAVSALFEGESGDLIATLSDAFATLVGTLTALGINAIAASVKTLANAFQTLADIITALAKGDIGAAFEAMIGGITRQIDILRNALQPVADLMGRVFGKESGGAKGSQGLISDNLGANAAGDVVASKQGLSRVTSQANQATWAGDMAMWSQRLASAQARVNAGGADAVVKDMSTQNDNRNQSVQAPVTVGPITVNEAQAPAVIGQAVGNAAAGAVKQRAQVAGEPSF